MPAPTLPTITSAWRFRVNVVCTEEDGPTTHRQRLIYEIVRSWLWLGTGWTDSAGAASAMSNPPWAVVTSSDAVAYDTTNRWAALGDIVWAGSGVAHSHIQLVHEHYFGTNDPLYVLFDCSENSDLDNVTLGIYLSREGFSEGGTTDRPTAADEIAIKPAGGRLATAGWQGADNGTAEDNRTGRLHFMMSADGRFVRAFICRNGVCVAFWDLLYDSEYDDGSQWSHPIAMAVMSSGDNYEDVLAYSTIDDAINHHRTRDDLNVAAQFGLIMEMPYAGATAVTELSANSCGGFSGVHPIRLSGVTPGSGGGFTAMRDAWWGRTVLSYQQHPNDGTLRFTQFGIIVVPWNRSVAYFG